MYDNGDVGDSGKSNMVVEDVEQRLVEMWNYRDSS